MSYRKIRKFRDHQERRMEDDYDEKTEDLPNYMKGIEHGKITFFYNNGNWLDRPKPILVSSKTCRTLSTLYDHCSEVLNLRVRNIFTPGGSTKIGKVGDMKNGGYYVGCGNNSFKKRPYNEHLKPWSHGTPRQPIVDQTEFNKRYANVSSKYQETTKYQCMRIRVKPYDKPEENPKPAIIDLQKSFENNLIKINQDRRVVNYCLRERDTNKLVTSLEDLNKEVDYILIRKGKDIPWYERTLPSIEPKMKNASPNSVASDPQTRKWEARREKHGGIHSKAVKHNHSQERDGHTDRDNGVFKPKTQNQHTKGAKEIGDSKDTRVDLPIDQVQAEEVEEERIRNDGFNTDRQPAKETTQKTNSKTNPTPKVADHSHHGGGGHQDKQNTKKHAGTRGEFNNVSPLPPISKQNNDNRAISPAWSDMDNSKAQKENEPPSTDQTNQKAEKQKDEKKANDASKTDDKQKKKDDDDKNKKVDDTKKENMTEDEAATKIQAGFRGYQGRKEVNKKKEDAAKVNKQSSKPQNSKGSYDEEEMAATRIQANYRGYKTRKSINQNKNTKKQNNKEMDENSAATKIQANFRGHRTRQDLKQKQKQEEDKAATKIQANYRGHKARKDIKQRKEEEEAATKIQATFRGHQTRKELKNQNK